ncbi:diphosphate--fructose-6-phosphate 1-phosphotransferase [Alkalitalea saponilacus]|uniref:Pyrophosphate--fructose 6-phosphate 1-phosphotransferase n=1 Tax=Alkalitalea saponilacus TaxID=889453 RepID=A0A1T5HAZ1_9BACT|nr:diphosphate--fructose-6-phosphate 1-phosphotransferase [Alkalitalea saponilacus]ASB50786.1 diphosphate--fructose-6-phosphate 1-phosphotransferase [Alkalitalea saponilacus]SKC17885.1 pyrophosphate--fructose-6-phosphate 1-phosphotransferase [Alkalitalea saponilacus]
MVKSPLQIARESYFPKLPASLKGAVKIVEGNKTESVADQADIKKMFPNTYGMPVITFESGSESKEYPAVKVGVILSGGQAPGGHNVISGLFDGLLNCNKENKLFGFLGGPSGLTDNQFVELTAEVVDHYRNTGGFDIIGSGRTKLEEEAQFDKVIENCKALGINALVVIGGDDSNTNACVLAEYFLQKKAGIQVIGVPKTIDGDLKNEVVETSFGFDTACKTYSELIGNIQRDANSAKKYYHFIRLMGRSASHICLECALQTQPNITIISEEVEAKGLTLDDIVDYIADIVVKRAENGDNFGTILIPEGVVEFVPAMKKLISELNDILAKHETEVNVLDSNKDRRDFVATKLTEESATVFTHLPNSFANQLMLDRDPHGNVQVSAIETEKLLIDMVKARLKKLKKSGDFSGKFGGLGHFFGYEGRCATPSNFDADYCYSLGITASLLISEGKSGYMASVKNLTAPAEEWIPGGAPITMMMNMEKRHGAMKPVIQKALVVLDGAPFKKLDENREDWAMGTKYVYPGPIQYFGPKEVCDTTTHTLRLEQAK